MVEMTYLNFTSDNFSNDRSILFMIYDMAKCMNKSMYEKNTVYTVYTDVRTTDE
mgnify:CR=1